MRTVFIANRGEIACRLIQACHELGWEAVVAFTPEDGGSRHVQLADRTMLVSSYLSVEAVLEAAQRCKAEALHPGYGFLSENAALAEACQTAGIVFVGPSAEAIRLMGDKLAAKRLAAEVGVPLLLGSENEDPAPVGFPLLIKAAGGGGGKGMRAVAQEDDFEEALAAAKREARMAFGDDRVFLERLVTHGRHIEVQVFGDQHGTVMALGERDCSIQRRYQKILEESPAPHLSDELRGQLHASAVALARAVNYVGPGTVEFLVEGDRYAFLEMNTRLQVEHPVTEVVTGLDLAKLQLLVAFGGNLPASPEVRGHAIEVRIYAEDADAGFLPATGEIKRLELPNGPGIRNDIGIQTGDAVGVAFDPMLAKLIVWGTDRQEALARVRDALKRYCLLGVSTNLPFLLRLVMDDDLCAGRTYTRFLEEHPLPPAPVDDLRAAADAWQGMQGGVDPFRRGWRDPEGASRTPDGGLFLHGRRYYVAEDDLQVEVWSDGRRGVFKKPQAPDVETSMGGKFAGVDEHSLEAPMPGVLTRLLVREGSAVAPRQTLMVLEAMKMEHPITAPKAAVVRRIHFKVGDLVQAGSTLIELDDPPAD